MSKFKIGDIVNVEYFENFFIKCKILHINQLNCYLEILEETEYTKVGDTFSYKEKYLKQIESIEVKQVLQTKPNNDFIYFKDLDMVFPKKIFQEDVLNIRLAQFEKDNNVINGFGVFLYSKKMLIKGFETKEQAQKFIKQLADLLGSDIL